MGWQNYSAEYLLMIINLFVLWYPSAQIFTNNYFCEALFKAQSNLITSERKIDKVKVCGESDYFSHLGTDDVTLTMTNPTSCLKESHRNRYYECVLPGTQRCWTLSLRQKSAHLCRGFHASCRSLVCSVCSWPSPSLVGRLPNVGASVQGEGTAHRCWCAHRDLGGKEDWGKASVLWFQFGFYFGVLNESNSYTILFTASSLFSDFFHRIWCGPESYSRPARHIQRSWGGSHPELSLWNKLEQLQHFLVQAVCQWRDDFPYWSGFLQPECKGWLLLHKFSEIT